MEAFMEFKLVHTNINVFDLERSVDFYEKAVGLRVVRQSEAADGSFKIAFLSDEAESGGRPVCYLELTWLRGHAPYQLGDNESHICFQTSEFANAHELHAAMNCICYENKSMGLYFIEDPDGYWLEIVPKR
jgi:lactoylglutathione lyase